MRWHRWHFVADARGRWHVSCICRQSQRLVSNPSQKPWQSDPGRSRPSRGQNVAAPNCARYRLCAAGSPCQGFSVQGLGLRLQVSRSLTLFHVLQTTWHHQACGLVLERVTEITQHEDVMAALQLFGRPTPTQTPSMARTSEFFNEQGKSPTALHS